MNEQEVKSMFASYSGKVKLVTQNELYEKIMSGRACYIFDLTISSSDKFITIYNSKDGSVVYRDYTPISYTIKDKDIRKITDL